MKIKFLSLGILVILFLIPIKFTIAFEHVDNVNEGISTFFLTSLETGENIEVNVTHTGTGNFTLFLFDQRPNYSHIKIDKTLDEGIFSIAINYSLADNPYINYTVSESKIYYIQVILLDNGPDTFFLESNHDLTQYYIPIIPGYPIPLFLSSCIITTGLILILYRKKKN